MYSVDKNLKWINTLILWDTHTWLDEKAEINKTDCEFGTFLPSLTELIKKILAIKMPQSHGKSHQLVVNFGYEV